ncbi:MAG: homoserine dehydrogenase [Kofleriaceae bacterium]|jgi:homoserine dehydrogenase|nr:homoserine dehydrogenase [Kofleriaceae bacterium]MBP6847840.1 homoserine dehydrogenase [Kofleriaceae bacterium]MBP9208404.1 homoserine dehydrogenase [Kofleriaceae bacterium]
MPSRAAASSAPPDSPAAARGPDIGVALLGLGNVGAGVITLLAENAAAIEARLGARLVVRAVAVRARDKKRLVDVDPALLSTDVIGTARRADVDVVCELIGGTDAARTAVLAAIRAGKHVVTANKALLAERGAEVFAAAEHHQVDVYYEAAVCGGVPVIRVLREGLASDRIEHLVGIVNGTSNYILSTMAAAGRDFAAVLREAQQLGYAEADPTLDVGGGDAAHKLAILVMLCFGALVDPAAILTEGIDQVDAVDIAYAGKLGYVIKPLALARDHGHAIEARVHPTLVPAHWLLADVPGAKNALYVHSRALGSSMYYGAGAGMLPTAVAVVSDLIEIARNITARAAGAPPMRRHQAAAGRPLLPAREIRSRYYLRFAVADRPGVLGQLMTVLGAHHTSVAQVIQEEAEPGPGGAAPTARVVVITHEAQEGQVRAALAEIDALPAVMAPTRVLRIAAAAVAAGEESA